MRERLAVVCMLALLSVGSASAQTPLTHEPSVWPAFRGDWQGRDTLRERMADLFMSNARVRFLASTWLREFGVDSAAHALGVPFRVAAPSPRRLAARDRAAGWPSLRHDTLATGRELRLWIHTSLTDFSTTGLRLVQRGENVEGWMVGSGKCGSRPVRPISPNVDESHGVRCLYRWRTEPDWRAAWDALDAAGIWMLPDESTVPGPMQIVMDDISVTVELRNRSLYRTYQLQAHSPGYEDAVLDLMRVGRKIWNLRL